MTREDELIYQWKQGDDDALDALIGLFYPEILRYCLWHAPHRSLAEDAAQETFLKLVRYLDRYVHRGKFKPFLYQIAAHTCLDMRRKRQLAQTSLDASPLELADPENAFERVQADLDFRQTVAALPEEWRELVILRFGQDLTMREIAAIVELPLRTVQSRLRAAQKQLQATIAKGEA